MSQLRKVLCSSRHSRKSIVYQVLLAFDLLSTWQNWINSSNWVWVCHKTTFVQQIVCRRDELNFSDTSFNCNAKFYVLFFPLCYSNYNNLPWLCSLNIYLSVCTNCLSCCCDKMLYPQKGNNLRNEKFILINRQTSSRFYGNVGNLHRWA